MHTESRNTKIPYVCYLSLCIINHDQIVAVIWPDDCHVIQERENLPGSISIRHLSDIIGLDRCLIDIEPKVFAIWDIRDAHV